jgi:hypothetical protein
MRYFKFIGTQRQANEYHIRPILDEIYHQDCSLGNANVLEFADSISNRYEWEEVFTKNILSNKLASEMTVFEKLVCDLVIYSDFQLNEIDAIRKAKDIIQAIENDK